MPTKICPRCKKDKDWIEYNLNQSGRDKGKPITYCKKCSNEKLHIWHLSHPKRKIEQNHLRGINRPISEAKECSNYLGVFIAEKVLSKFFDNITRMPYGNPGFDYICERGFKIDVKSCCLRKNKDCATSQWHFHIRNNTIADYFLCLGFDNRENLEPQHIWLIPGNIVNNKIGLCIINTEKSLSKWSQYEKPLDKVIICCNKMKEKKEV